MPSLVRSLLALQLGLLGGGLAAAPNPAPTATAAPGAASSQTELDALSTGSWVPATTARASLGWRDNILLSPFAPLERFFARGEVEAILFRPLPNQWEFVSFLSGDVIRYFSPPPETSGEQQWMINTQGRWQPISSLRLSLKAVGYLQDMVVDLSETETQRRVEPTRVRGAYLGASGRLALPAGFRLEPMVQVRRSNYLEYAGDYDEVKGGGRLEWSGPAAWGVSVGWFEIQRAYDQRTQYTVGGRPLPGTQLRFRQRDGEVKVRTAWDAGGAWTLAVAAGQFENRDQASGYFDYDQKRGRCEISWERQGWRIFAEGVARRMDYLNQTVGAGIAPPPRTADDFETNLRVERDVNPRWTCFAEYRWERSRSNEADFNYRANSVLAGWQRSF